MSYSLPPISSSPLHIAFHHENEISQYLAEQLAQCIDSSVAARGQFCVALSGGSLLGLLAHEAVLSVAKRTADAWRVFFVDERCVALSHADSNAGAALAKLLAPAGVARHHVYTLNDFADAAVAARLYEADVRKVVGVDGKGDDARVRPRFDLVLLGMGPDAHTASLFPSHALLDEQSLLVAWLNDSPKPPPTRVTFTLPLIAAARRIIAVATGDAKRDAVRRVLLERDTSLPMRRVIDLATRDAAAAGGASKFTMCLDKCTGAVIVDDEPR